MKKPKKTPSMPALKVPKVARDLYADLRDRHLLALVAVLLIAIVAVPFLLAGKGEEQPAEPATPAFVPGASPGAAAASFSVVPADPGLRDYKRRLGHRQARNPFKGPTPEAASAKGGGEGSPSAGEGESPSSGSAAGESGSAEVTDGGSASGGSDEGSTTADEVVVEQKIVGYEIDTHAGFLGHIHDHEGIKPVAKLPSPQNPVVVFTGLSSDNKRALFLMSNSVTAYYGKGTCGLGGETCQVLELKQGQSATFAYGYGDTRYKLSLRKIVPVIETRTAVATVKRGN